jgi:hypothetical protein
MEFEGSQACLQEPAISPCCEPDNPVHTLFL